MQQLNMRPVVWSIAASDSGGGAGVQADILTITDLSAHACTVISGVTAQNSMAVDLVEPVSQQMLLQQLNTLAEDMPPAAIKIGLLINQEQVELVSKWLTEYFNKAQHVPVVLDPVFVATCGDKLNNVKQLDYSPFKNITSVITPNYAELHQLTQHVERACCSIRAQSLSQFLDCSVLAKGGDDPEHSLTVKDVLVCRHAIHCSDIHSNAVFTFTNSRVSSKNTHGTGCTLSSAIATFLAYGYSLQDAVVQANAYVHKGIKHSYKIGSGAGPIARTGWPDDYGEFPAIESNCLALKLVCDKECKTMQYDIGVYPIVDNIELLETLLLANCKIIQLRIKQEVADIKGNEWLESQINTAVELGKRHDSQVFINDHWQLALKYKAFGVHLGQEDLLKTDLVEIKSKGLALGLSSHGVFEAIIANQLKPSYLAIGHIYATPTKAMPSNPQGIAKVVHQVKLFDGQLPLVAIGGVNLDRLKSIKQTGIQGVAVVRAITQADNISEAFNKLEDEWQEAV